jgi:transcriptional regulator GlxA family with amidase domain
MPRKIDLLIYPEFQLLDAAGPIAAFEVAERHRPGSYALRVVAVVEGLVRSSSGVCLPASKIARSRRLDTLMISGGDGSRAAALCPITRRFVTSCTKSARRVATWKFSLNAQARQNTVLGGCCEHLFARFWRVQLESDNGGTAEEHESGAVYECYVVAA